MFETRFVGTRFFVVVVVELRAARYKTSLGFTWQAQKCLVISMNLHGQQIDADGKEEEEEGRWSRNLTVGLLI